MKPAGIVLLIYLSIIFIKYRDLKTIFAHIFGLTVAVEMFINTGYFIILGDNEIFYSDFLIGIASLIALFTFVGKRSAEYRKANSKATLAIITLFISSILLVFFPYRLHDNVAISSFILWQAEINEKIIFSVSTILRMIRFLLFFICGVGLINNNDGQNIRKICSQYIYVFGVSVFIFLLFELITKAIMGSLMANKFVELFFGRGGSTLSFILNRGGLVALQGFTREPIFLSSSLFLSSIMILLSDYNKAKKYTFVFIAMLFIIISASFSGVMFTFLLVLILEKGSNKTIFKVVTAIIAVIVVLVFLFNETGLSYLSYISRRFSNLFSFFTNNFVADNSTSDQTRLKGIIDMLYLWIQRPLFGVGLGTYDTYAAFPSMLCNIGILGTLMWWSFVRTILGRSLNSSTKRILFCIVTAFSFSGSISIMYSVSIIYVFYIMRENVSSVNKINKTNKTMLHKIPTAYIK